MPDKRLVRIIGRLNLDMLAEVMGEELGLLVLEEELWLLCNDDQEL